MQKIWPTRCECFQRGNNAPAAPVDLLVSSLKSIVAHWNVDKSNVMSCSWVARMLMRTFNLWMNEKSRRRTIAMWRTFPSESWHSLHNEISMMWLKHKHGVDLHLLIKKCAAAGWKQTTTLSNKVENYQRNGTPTYTRYERRRWLWSDNVQNVKNGRETEHLPNFVEWMTSDRQQTAALIKQSPNTSNKIHTWPLPVWNYRDRHIIYKLYLSWTDRFTYQHESDKRRNTICRFKNHVPINLRKRLTLQVTPCSPWSAWASEV